MAYSEGTVLIAALATACSALVLAAAAACARRWRNRRSTETDKLALSVSHMEAVLEAASEYSIIATDPEGAITLFNRGAERMLGYEASEMIGIATPLLFHSAEEVRERGLELSEELGHPVTGFHVFVEAAKRGMPDHREWTYRHKNGRFFPVDLTVTPIYGKRREIRGFLGIARDISVEKKLGQTATQAEADMRYSKQVIRETIEAQEKERTRLARELHDGIGQSLYYVSLTLHSLLANAKEEHLRELIRIMLDQLDHSIRQIRSFAFQLRPPALDHLGLPATIHRLLASYEMSYPQVKTRSSYTLPFSVDPAASTHLYRIIQEAVSNAIRHAEATRIEVSLEPESSEKIVLSIADNGKGMTPDAIGTGLGLRHMEERVHALGGVFQWVSELGGGTEIRAFFPADALRKVEAPAQSK